MLRRLWLTPEEEKGYYYGFSNEGLWPLCHIAHTRPVFRSEDYHQYQAVNQRFADAVCEEVDSDDPIILVQDYHFALLPRMIRERLPRATVLTFWHIPWPNSERFGICPWRDELLAGHARQQHPRLPHAVPLQQLRRHASIASWRRGSIASRARWSTQGHWTLVRPYPISHRVAQRLAEGQPPVAECRAEVVAELGLAPDALIGVGVDRLDYTKGIEERLLAVERLLERAELRGRFTFVQLAAPSRTHPAVPAARRERRGGGRAREPALLHGGYRPIIVLRAHHEPPRVFRFYRAADVCYVSSLHDGMNLVAKEFVAARDDERGVLVLSDFAGAARELTEAVIVNPYDLEQASRALGAALTDASQEQGDRMRAMRAFVAEFNVYRWAGRMLVDAARLRRRERLAGRLSRLLPGSADASP